MDARSQHANGIVAVNPFNGVWDFDVHYQLNKAGTAQELPS